MQCSCGESVQVDDNVSCLCKEVTSLQKDLFYLDIDRANLAAVCTSVRYVLGHGNDLQCGCGAVVPGYYSAQCLCKAITNLRRDTVYAREATDNMRLVCAGLLQKFLQLKPSR